MLAFPSFKTRTKAAPRPRDTVGPVRRFWRRVSDGLAAPQLWKQFHTEARASYEHYRTDVDWGPREKEHRVVRSLRIAHELFWAILMKLSPARRVALLLAVAAAALGGITFTTGHLLISLNLRGWGFLLLLVLLGLELADRVTMKRDLEIALGIQRSLLPESAPVVPGFEIAFATQPAKTVSGDYYDAFFPGLGGKRVLFVVADVAGKGVPAALLMATFQASLHSVAGECDGPLELAERLNQFACARSGRGARFTTAFLAELDIEALSLRYVNAGHNPPVLRRADGSVERLEQGGLPFGIDIFTAYECGETRLGRADLLFVFTDGVVEGIDAKGAEYGEERMLEALGALTGESAERSIRAMIESVGRYCAGTPQYDDITCLAVRME